MRNWLNWLQKILKDFSLFSIEMETLNRKTKWYRLHKDDPMCVEKWNLSKKEYYERNKEAIREKMLRRYYLKKGVPYPYETEATPV